MALNSTRHLEDVSAEKQFSYHAAARGTVPSRAGNRQRSATVCLKSLHGALEILLGTGLSEDSAEIKERREQIRRLEAGELISTKSKQNADDQDSDSDDSEDEELDNDRVRPSRQVEEGSTVGVIGMSGVSAIAGGGTQFHDASQPVKRQLHEDLEQVATVEYEDMFDFGAASSDTSAKINTAATDVSQIDPALTNEVAASIPNLVSHAASPPHVASAAVAQEQPGKGKRKRVDLAASVNAVFKRPAKRHATEAIRGHQLSESTANDPQIAVALQKELWDGNAQGPVPFTTTTPSVKSSAMSFARPSSSNVIAKSDAERAEEERVEKFRSDLPLAKATIIRPAMRLQHGIIITRSQQHRG